MKKLFILLLSSVGCFAQLGNPGFLASLKPATASGAAADATENFEGTGYELTWVEESGDANPDQSTSGLSLESSQCLYIDGNSNAEETYLAFTASDTAYLYMLFRFEDLNTGTRQQWAFKNGTTLLCNIGCSTGPVQWKINDNHSVTDTGSGASVDTTYHVWFEYEKGTGSDAKIRFYFSTDGTKPGSADCEITTSTETLQANRLYLGTWGSLGGNMYFDKVRFSRTTAFGSNPT